MAKALDENIILKTIELVKGNVSKETALSLLGISEHTYLTTKMLIGKAKVNDVEGMLKYRKTDSTIMKVVAKHFCIELPEEKPMVKLPVQPVEVKAQTNDNTALVMVQILKELRELNENMRCLMDADLAKFRESVEQRLDSTSRMLSIMQGTVEKIRIQAEDQSKELTVENCVSYIMKILRKNSGSQTESYLDSKLRSAGYDDTVIANSKQWLCDNAKVYLRYTGSGASRVTQLVLK